MNYVRAGCVAMLLMLFAAPAQADYGTGDSASFTLDLLTLPSDQAGDWSDSGTFSLDLSKMNRDYADSGTFFFGENPNPAPLPFTIEVPSTASPGQPFDVRVVMRNNGGPGDHGGVSISFPELVDTDDTMPPYELGAADVAVHLETTFATVGFADAGDTIYYEGDPIIAQHLLVEGDEDAWDYNEEHTLILTITPHEIGDLTIRIRLWIAGLGSTYGPPVYRRPDQDGPDSKVDQQGYWAREICVAVDIAELPGSIDWIGARELQAIGANGAGVKVGLLGSQSPEDNGLPWTGHNALQGCLLNGEPDYQLASSHETNVAGVLAGFDRDAAIVPHGQPYSGLAPAATITSVDSGSGWPWDNIDNAMLALRDAGSIVISYSGGFDPQGDGQNQVGEINRTIDAIVDEDNVVIVCAAGNRGQDDLYTIACPANALNVLAVGTLGAAEHGGDAKNGPWNKTGQYNISGPTTGDYFPGRCKPDLVAPGDCTVPESLFGNPGHYLDTVVAGSSIATPHVAGGLALLVNVARMAEASGQGLSFVDPFGVVDSRTLRSALLTSADKSVLALVDPDDPQGPTRPWQTAGTQQPLDLSLGAGGLDLLEAKQVLLGETTSDPQGDTILRGTLFDVIHWQEGGIGLVTWPLGYITEPSQFTATLVWNAHYDGILSGIELNNLDLYLMRDGVEVTRSDSAIDNVEHIYIHLDQPGDYSLEIRYVGQQTDVVDPEPFGISYRLVPDDFSLMIPGDMDCSGTVDMADVPLFVEALLDPIGFDVAHPGCGSEQADVDASGVVNSDDTKAFVQALLPSS